jgi:hypothetical protein
MQLDEELPGLNCQKAAQENILTQRRDCADPKQIENLHI